MSKLPEKCILLGIHESNKHNGNVILVGKWTLEEVISIPWYIRRPQGGCYTGVMDVDHEVTGVPNFRYLKWQDKCITVSFARKKVKGWGVNEFHADDPAIASYLNLLLLTAAKCVN